MAAAIGITTNRKFRTYSIPCDHGHNRVELMSEKLIVVVVDH